MIRRAGASAVGWIGCSVARWVFTSTTLEQLEQGARHLIPNLGSTSRARAQRNDSGRRYLLERVALVKLGRPREIGLAESYCCAGGRITHDELLDYLPDVGRRHEFLQDLNLCLGLGPAFNAAKEECLPAAFALGLVVKDVWSLSSKLGTRPDDREPDSRVWMMKQLQ